jgi:hypothetical protein
LVPAKNGAIPETPGGWHSSQSGTLVELGLVAVPTDDDPAEPDDGAAEGVDRAETAPTPEPTPGETPAGDVLDSVAAFEGVVVPGNVTPPYAFVRPVPAMLEVWAAAGFPSNPQNSNAV